MRDTRKDEEYFKGFLQDIEDDIEKRLGKMDRIDSMNPIASVNIPKALFEYYTRSLKLQYCLGEKLSSFKNELIEALKWLHTFEKNGQNLEDREDKEYFASKHALTISNYYHYVWWLTFALGAGLEQEDIASAMALFGQAGEDQLFDLIMVQLGEKGRKIGKGVIYKSIFAKLLGVVEAPEADRPGLMQVYLDGWYASTLKEGLHDDHNDQDFYYTGYWCYEAALVVMLWNIDDSSFRNNPYYPKDLVRKL
jgi:hypothetical protein